MAKRKRLTPAQSAYLDTETPVLETKSMGFAPPPGRAPIAQVAGDASAASALQDLATEIRTARDEGRLIQALPEASIDAGYLVRDRMLAEDDELQALMASLAARGQQAPIEVVELHDGRYGLISGWRRLTALRRLLADTGEDRFAQVQAILRRPETAAEAYVAMVEENEIRVGLSYYERARVAAKAVEQRVYENERYALLELFASASRGKRSKIGSFLTVYRHLDAHLKFGPAIPERLGLALAKALEADPKRAGRLAQALRDTAPETPAAETACLEWALKIPVEKTSLNCSSETDVTPDHGPAAAPEEPRSRAMPQGTEMAAPGIQMSYSGNSLTLRGPGVSDAFRARLRRWLNETL